MTIKMLVKSIFLGCLMLMASCTLMPPTQEQSPVPVVKKDKPKSVEPAVNQVNASSKATVTAPIVGASVLTLLDTAREQAEAGDGEKAAETLERAIKIEPNNPWLWHRLAVLRMQQKKWSQSVELANRSIALAKGNKRLIGGNWLVISLALEGAGNHVSAAKAKENSDIYLGKE